MQCNNCGQTLAPGAEFCGNCGAKLVSAPGAAPQPQPTPVNAAPSAQTATPTAVPPTVAAPMQPAAATMAPSATVQPVATSYAVPRIPSNGFSVASLVLGILALLSFIFWPTAVLFGILALIFGFIGRSKGSKSMALGGIITGALGIVVSITIIAMVISHCSNNNSTEFCRGVNSFQFYNPLHTN
jgi:hypothetical protein